jgi:hypothetical protein
MPARIWLLEAIRRPGVPPGKIAPFATSRFQINSHKLLIAITCLEKAMIGREPGSSCRSMHAP